VRVFASPQPWHALAQFFDREKTFLISGEQTIDAFADTDEITPERLRLCCRFW
jgi:hypothetical protein